MRRRGAAALLGLSVLAGAGCATMDDATRDLPGVKRMKYTIARADREHRVSLERGQMQLRAREYGPAVRSLREALWDLEQIEKPSLRLEELAEVRGSLAEAYAGQGKTQWGDEQRALAQALIAYRERPSAVTTREAALAKAKAAYRAAHFRDALTAFGQALVELEGLSPTPARVQALEEARCHLVLAYFALGQEDRAGEEVRGLAVRTGATASCRKQAPPPVQALIRDVEVSEARLGKRSAE